MSAPVFVDSGALIAFLDRSDGLHMDVAALFANPPRRLYTSILVVSETYSWLLHRLGEEAARRLRGLLGAVPGLRLLGLSDSHHRDVEAKLDMLRGCKLSYVDASSLVLIRSKRIKKVWGTDHHLGLEGAMVVPGAAG